MEEVKLTETAVPRKQEHPLNTAVGFSVQKETKVGVDVATVTVRGRLRFPSRAGTVVVVVTVAVLYGIGVNMTQVCTGRVTYIVPTMDEQYGLACAAFRRSCRKQLSW